MKAKSRAVLPCGRPVPPAEKNEHDADLRKSWKERLSAYLTEKELKQSESRNRIIETILSHEGHFSVSELVKRVQDEQPSIGAATVYRNIPVLLDFGLIRETLSDEDGQMIYEVAGDAHHDHIVCLDCRHIFEFHDEQIESAQEKISRKMSFKPTNHRHVIYARCAYKS